MNINDLPQGSYTIEHPSNTLNVNNLPKGSYTTEDLGAGLSSSNLVRENILKNPADQKSADRYGATFPAVTGEGPLAAGAKAAGNLPSSALNFGKGILNSALHPIQTVKGIGQAAIGAIQRGGEKLGLVSKGDTTPSEQTFDSLASSLKDRFGSFENLQRSATNDPFGFGSDVVAAIQGGAKLADVVTGAKTAEAANATKYINEIGDTTKGILADPTMGADVPSAIKGIQDDLVSNFSGKGAIANGVPNIGPKILEKITALDPADYSSVDDFLKDANSITGKGQGLFSTVTNKALTAPGKAVENIAGEAAKGLANQLQKLSLRLTPVQKQRLGGKLDGITSYITDNNVVGTPDQRYAKMTSIVNDKEDTLQNFLSTDAKDVTVPRSQILDQMENLKSAYQDEGTDVLDVERQIDRAKSVIQTKYPENIPVARLNNFKRAVYKNAYNVTGDKVLDSVEHDIGDIAKTSIEGATDGLSVNGKSIGDFNNEYGLAIQSKKLLKIAASRPQMGSWGRLTTRLVTGLIGFEEGGYPGLIAGEVVGNPIVEHSITPIRSLAATALSKGPGIANQLKIPTSLIPATSISRNLDTTQAKNEPQE